MSEPELLAADMRSRFGHYEVLGETYAKFEFFEKGWNPYSRFLDVDKVDLILRRRTATGVERPASTTSRMRAVSMSQHTVAILGHC
jgi:hypothetical protein